ncbi:MAG: beta-galactosidase GalB [Thermoguttaceae bacterium]
MKSKSARIGLVCCFVLLAAAAAPAAEAPRQVIPLDQDWRFHLGEVDNGQAPALDDSSWRKLDVPHDWSIEGPFDRQSPSGNGGGYLNGGIGWYRKTFAAAAEWKDRRVTIEFDGAYMDSDVWLNGEHLGRHPYGYTGFAYDLTPHLAAGGPNTLAVRLCVKQPCSRWYSGAGIFRHVRLVVTSPVHVAHWGTYVTTPEISKDAATVRVRTRVANQSNRALEAIELRTRILSGDQQVASTGEVEIAMHEDRLRAGEHVFDRSLSVPSPRCWSLADPYLYTVVSEVIVDGNVVDTYCTPFGIRSFEFTKDKGFFLNGKHVPLNGVCNHHDLGCLGAAVNRRAIQRQLEILKGMGCNAIRTSHNPPAPELLDLCDRMGFVVMDEAFDEWKAGKTPNGYGRFFDEWSERDIVSMLDRDRNHPCVVLWSIGNEINEQGAADGGRMAKRLADFCRREDPTRPTTSACNNPGKADRTGFAEALDVFGINYGIGSYKGFKDKYVLVASETSSALSTRGEYGLQLDKQGAVEVRKKFDFQVTSYDLFAPGWGYTAEKDLLALIASPWVAGEFVWTGFDYIGEPTPYGWPSRSSYFGIVDLAGFPKDRYYLYQSVWRTEPVVHLLPHWNWPGFEGRPIPVWCITNCDSVELFLNDKSLGEKKLDRQTSLHVEWPVPYQPGTLRAVGRRGGAVVQRDEVATAGPAVKLVLKPDRAKIAADGDDLSFVEVQVVDKEGRVCPSADHLVRFKLDGGASIAGVDNGDPTNHEPFKADRHKVFHGLGLVVVKATRTPGKAMLRAESEGLEAADVVIESMK